MRRKYWVGKVPTYARRILKWDKDGTAMIKCKKSKTKGQKSLLYVYWIHQ